MARAKPILPWLALAFAAVLFGVTLLLLTLPIDRFKPRIEARLTARLGTPVTIARIERVGGSLLTPEIVISGLAVRQPSWAGSGDWATVRSARFRLALLPALLGHPTPQRLSLDGLRLTLIRAADGRENWNSRGGGPGGPSFGALTLRDARIVYRDAEWQRSADLALTADATHGLDVTGTGMLRTIAVRIAAHGAPIAGATRWPFVARFDGPALTLRATGTMDRPLDSRFMEVDVQSRASDLRALEPVIENGLFDSQPVDLGAHARHDWPNWTITGLAGTIGHSRIAGDVVIRRREGRALVDGRIHADPFDFDDLASTAQLDQAAARDRAGQRRLVPAANVVLTKLARTDGALRFEARNMLGGSSPPIRSVSALLRLDHSLLIVAPLRIGLTRGEVRGSVTADQRGRPLPLVTMDLRLIGSNLSAVGGGGAIDGRASGTLRLAGVGRTIRDSVAASDGTIALAARDGSLPARLASLLGLDLGHALTTAGDARSGLRCAVLRLDVRHGVGRVRRLLVDTARARSSGSGAIDLTDERIAIALSGMPKQHSLIKLPGTIKLTGTLAAPHAGLAARDTSPGAILGAIGHAIAGKQPIAADADCASL